MMEEDRSHMTERILNLTLEIIGLLTRERFPHLKSGDHVTITVYPPPASILQQNFNEKILEVTQKIIDLLTGEVSKRCLQNFKEERLEGQKNLQKDLTMEDEPDGSRKRNPPQRCPRPLEDLPIPRRDQVGEDGGHKDLYMDVMMEPPNDKNPPQRCPRPLEDPPIPRHHQVEKPKVKIEEEEAAPPCVRGDESTREGEMMVKEEESTDGSVKRNPPQRCPSPLDSRDSTQEDHTYAQHDQGGDVGGHNVHVKEEYVEEDEEYGGLMKELSEGHTDVMKEPPERCPLDSARLPRHDQSRELADLNPDLKKEFKEEDEEYGVMEDLTIPRHDQGEDLMKMKVESEVVIEETYVGDGQPFTDESGMMTFIDEDGTTRTCVDECAGKETTSSAMDGGHHSVESPWNPSGSGQRRTGKDGAKSKGEKNFSCSECGKRFKTQLKLSVHQRSHTGEKLYPCSECGKSFSQKGSLSVHLRTHTGEKLFSCSECGKCFQQKHSLFIHLRSHTGERPFVCNECGSSFVQKTHLSRHQRLHTGEKPYCCLECGKSYPRKSDLVIHQRWHLGEKPFTCEECGKFFSQKSSFNKHLRLHMGKKLYSCPECGNFYTQKGNLARHMKSHTAKKVLSLP